VHQPAAREVGLDDLPDAVVVADPAGVVVIANAEAARLAGRTTDTLVGDRLDSSLPLTDAQGRDWWEHHSPLTSGADGAHEREAERLLTLGRPDGGDIEVFVTTAYVRDPEGQLVRIVVCLRDTDTRSRYERSSTELVSVVAHELRSPLTSVKGFTATLLAKWDRFDDEQKLHMLRTVNADADRLTRLISELLDVSRIETGRLELRRQVVDLPEIIRRDIAARVAAGEQPERFVLTVAEPLPELWADPDKLAQVVGNVIENALRHGAGLVTVAVSASDDTMNVEVTDEGEGVSPAALPRIFTKFWHDARRGGTGLGLYIAKGIVDAHGGTIEAGEAPSGGAAVRFAIPVSQPGHPA
jgi:PAS domain S-box-containing protein